MDTRKQFIRLCFFAGIACLVILYIAWSKDRFASHNPCLSETQTSLPATHETQAEDAPGPVAPYPPIDQFVRAKIIQECVDNGECLTFQRLEYEYGVRLICLEEVQRYGTGKPVNFGDKIAHAPCSKVVEVELRKGIRVSK